MFLRDRGSSSVRRGEAGPAPRRGAPPARPAFATRRRNRRHGRACALASKPRPARMRAARASAECASISESRACSSAIRWGSVAPSASWSRAARSLSAARTVSISVRGPPGASCSTLPIRAPFGKEIDPWSGDISPAMARTSVVFPAPLRQTKPDFAPSGNERLALSMSVRPAIRSVRSLICSMGKACRRASRRKARRGRSFKCKGPDGDRPGPAMHEGRRYCWFCCWFCACISSVSRTTVARRLRSSGSSVGTFK